MNNRNEKITQGSQKILRYIEDLVRNKNFRKDLKRFRNLRKKSLKTDISRDINDELWTIIQGYEELRKRTQKILNDDLFKIREKIADKYGLDFDLVDFASAVSNKNEELKKLIKVYAEDIDMCRITNLRDDYLNPANKGEEIIYLRQKTQLFYTAYPVAIAINAKATKRDVLDFIEKKWPWIDSQRFQEMKPLRIRPRKYKQEIIDFLWEYQSLTSKTLKNKLDENFPKNGIVYFEINNLLRDERKRRNQELT